MDGIFCCRFNFVVLVDKLNNGERSIKIIDLQSFAVIKSRVKGIRRHLMRF